MLVHAAIKCHCKFLFLIPVLTTIYAGGASVSDSLFKKENDLQVDDDTWNSKADSVQNVR